MTSLYIRYDDGISFPLSDEDWTEADAVRAAEEFSTHRGVTGVLLAYDDRRELYRNGNFEVAW